MHSAGRQWSQEAWKNLYKEIVDLARQGSDENTYTYHYDNKIITSAHAQQLLATVHPKDINEMFTSAK